MNNQPPSVDDQSNSLAQFAREMATDYRNAFIGIADSSAKRREDLHRDYATAGLAISGAAITILTISPHLPKTRILFYLGTLLVLLSIVLAFLSRHQLIQFMQNTMFYEERKYATIANASRSLQFNPDDPESRVRLRNAMDENTDNQPLMRKMAEHGHKIVGSLLLCGGSFVAISLVFRIQF